MARAIIEVDGLSKRYKLGQFNAATLGEAIWRRIRGSQNHPDSTEFWALKDASFCVEPGEVLGIIGANGAGKSTLLKILSRVTEPTSGSARIRGRVASLLEVGTGFHPELTGRENIFLNGAILGMTKAEIADRLDSIVAFAEIEKFLGTPVKRYSSGMYVRLAFAVAAHLDPEVLIVDEVLAVGDAAFQARCLGRMRDVAGEGRTVVFVSHNMLAVETLCQQALLLEAGRVVARGETQAVVQQYLSASADASTRRLASGGSNIRNVCIKDSKFAETEAIRLGEDVIFDVELFHSTRVEQPRVSIGIHSPGGQRLVTLHTDIQQNERWAFSGVRRIRAVWKDVRLAPGRYRVDVAFWGQSSEIDSLPGVRHLALLPTDVYGTGALPDPSYQGYLVPDVRWDVNVASDGAGFSTC